MTDESETSEEEKQLTAEQQLHYARWMHLALALGYNEIAKLGTTLGEKIFARMMRDTAVENLIEVGGNGGKSPFANEPDVVEIEMPERIPSLKLRPQDVELMRAYVAEHDARTKGEG